MDYAIEFLQPLATKEALTALGLLTACFLGWKVAQKGLGVMGSFASKASYGGLAAAVLGLVGAGGMGVGIGEIGSRWSEPNQPIVITPGVQNDELESLVQTFNGHSNPELMKQVMDYARERDGLSAKMSDDMIKELLAKTTKENAEVVGAIIELYKSREERRYQNGDYTQPQRVDAHTAVLPLRGPVVLTSYEEGSESPADPDSEESVRAETTNKDSICNLPTAYGLLFAGLASVVGSVITLRRKKTEVATS